MTIIERGCRYTAALLAVLGTLAIAQPAFADGEVLARVDGRDITRADVKFAEAEIGPELNNVPEADRLRAVVEYLVDNTILAAAAEKENLGNGTEFQLRLDYYRKRALRDTLFDVKVQKAVGEADAKKFYDDQVAKITPEEEFRARHILVEKEDDAKAIADRIAKGEDFAAIAKASSKDPGSGANGGDLGYFGKGQMVKPFEDAVMALKVGQVSAPVKSNFGFHIIKLEDRRSKPLPTFDSVKDRIVASLVSQKAQALMAELRASAKIEMIDPKLKAAAPAADPAAGAAPTTDDEGKSGQ